MTPMDDLIARLEGGVIAVRRWFCRHNYRPSKFQPLVPGTSYECSKCGRIIHHD